MAKSKKRKPEIIPENTTSDNISRLQPLKMKRSDAVMDEEIAAALIRNQGLQYIAARELGIHHSGISHRIAQSPYLQAIREECRQHRIDAAERSLSKMVDQEELGAVCFTLKTIGKDRGYIETVQHTVPPETINAFDSVMKQLSDKRENS